MPRSLYESFINNDKFALESAVTPSLCLVLIRIKWKHDLSGWEHGDDALGMTRCGQPADIATCFKGKGKRFRW